MNQRLIEVPDTITDHLDLVIFADVVHIANVHADDVFALFVPHGLRSILDHLDGIVLGIVPVSPSLEAAKSDFVHRVTVHQREGPIHDILSARPALSYFVTPLLVFAQLTIATESARL